MRFSKRSGQCYNLRVTCKALSLFVAGPDVIETARDAL